MQLEALVTLQKLFAAREEYKKLETPTPNSVDRFCEERQDLSLDIHNLERRLFDALIQGGLFEFVELVAKVRRAQLEYFAARQKGSPKAHCEKLLAKSKQLEAQLDKELYLFANPPML